MYKVEWKDHRPVVSGGKLSAPKTIYNLFGAGDSNPKTAKNIIPTMGLSLYPHRGIGTGNVCPFATTCVASCLAHQGQSEIPVVHSSRVAKTALWYLERGWFVEKLNAELSAFRRKHRGIIGVRLNMFSDIAWERYGVIDDNPDIQFYDYTKNPNRVGLIRPNYWATYSFDGLAEHIDLSLSFVDSGRNVSVVFHDDSLSAVTGRYAHLQRLPKLWHGRRVIDGGRTDWRPADPRGVVVGLRLLSRTHASRTQAINSGFSVAI